MTISSNILKVIPPQEDMLTGETDDTLVYHCYSAYSTCTLQSTTDHYYGIIYHCYRIIILDVNTGFISI